MTRTTPSSEMERRSPLCELEEDGESRTPPSQRLLTAILIRAIRDFVNYRNEPVGSDTHKIAVDAAGWIFWNGEEDFTYRWVCRLLGGDPVRTRKMILKMKPQDLVKMTADQEDGEQS